LEWFDCIISGLKGSLILPRVLFFFLPFFNSTYFLLLCYLIKTHTNIMDKKLRRSRNQIVAGVCAGFAEYMGWDVTLVRVIYALLSIFSAGFPGLILYIVLWVVMPLEGEDI